jgi:hypothetical protein
MRVACLDHRDIISPAIMGWWCVRHRSVMGYCVAVQGPRGGLYLVGGRDMQLILAGLLRLTDEKEWVWWSVR